MAIRDTHTILEAAGKLLGTGMLLTSTFVEIASPNLTTVGITHVMLEVAADPFPGVVVTQVMLEAAFREPDPLLLPDATSGLAFDSAELRPFRGSVLASDGPQRHTRLVFERVRTAGRVYRYTLRNATGEEVERVRQALEASRGGAIAVRFRAPVDDAGVKEYRVLNAGVDGSSFQVTRRAGGALGDLELVLEEV